MKRILLTLSCALLIATTYGQLPVSYLHKANPLPVTNLPAKPAGGAARGISQFEVSYHDMDAQQSDADGFSFGYFGWDLNNAFDVSCSPLDTLDDSKISWAAVVFDSIYDYQNLTAYNKNTFNSMTVDTVYFLYNHVNTSGLNDTLIVSVYAVANTPSGIQIGTNQKGDFQNTLLWSDTTITDASLTPTGGNDLYFAGIPTGGVSIPAGEGFIVRLDYYGPKEDLFNLADGNRLECDNAGAASTSIIPGNSFRYYNGGNYVPAPCSDLSGVGPLVFPTLPANCNQFYFQNIAISAVVTVDAPLSARATASLTVACPGDFVNLNSGASGGSGDISYTWSGNGNFTSPNSATTSVALPAGNGIETYTVTVIDNIENTTVTSSVNVTVRGITVNVGNDTTLNCGDSTLVTAATTGFLNGSTFTWSNGATTQSIYAKGISTNTVTVTNNAGCSATDTKQVDLNVNQSVSFDVRTLYNETIDTLLSNPFRACRGVTINFENTSTDLSSTWTWDWDYDDQTGSGNLNGVKIYSNDGVYDVTLTATDAGGCVITSAPVQLQILPPNHPLCEPVGIEEVKLLSNISLFPNPNTGSFTVDMTRVNADDANILVIDMLGKVVANTNTFSTAANPVQTIDLNNAANGIYFVRITADGVTVTSKISVAK